MGKEKAEGVLLFEQYVKAILGFRAVMHVHHVLTLESPVNDCTSHMKKDASRERDQGQISNKEKESRVDPQRPKSPH
jgi:hypothetical protein